MKPRAAVLFNTATRRWHFILFSASGSTVYKGPARMTKPEACDDRALLCGTAARAEYDTQPDAD